ncbi:MAG: tRNA (adenosine(37)-N6)-threonylcarbamoyltransferase complex transferase subunit TsaD [Acidobacteria bacterium]|nr:tRNA (adenosine(37)-N6)-threonylcarbamoyltransferase complex transferase subunit TsaD [Acidobacteriota bacterium]MCB9397105.1 tRNA (adenosine(37)-N6)-threonylcarbamoyltransferase complex transferase subunit TsaD [Acidobacteriota bacterium]
MILAIETSCDDTSVAVIDANRKAIACRVASQVKEHTPFAGVVPEIASRAHLTNLPQVYESVLSEAQIDLADLQAIAVTAGPGLIGSLLVGFNFAKALAYATQKPLLAVNHIRGHVCAYQLEHPTPPFPALALVVSGGHTHLFHVDAQHRLTLLAKTVDDAAGEAFDKLAKMLNLGFPGGPQIDKLAQQGDASQFRFNPSKFSDGYCHFSYSGFKTQAMRFIEQQPEAFQASQELRANLCAAFQKAVVDHLLDRVARACDHYPFQSLILGGGVACNSELRRRFSDFGAERQMPTLISSPRFCTDNAAMIGVEGWRLLESGELAPLNQSADMSWSPFDQVDLLRTTPLSNASN